MTKRMHQKTPTRTRLDRVRAGLALETNLDLEAQSPVLYWKKAQDWTPWM